MTAPVTKACVVGYASIDRKFTTGAYRGPGRTTTISAPMHGPRADAGAVSYFGLECARHGLQTSVVTWVGPDAHGDFFCERLRMERVSDGAVARSGTRSPSSYMFYPDNSEAVCFFDPGDVTTTLTEVQRAAIEAAEVVLLTVGPPDALTEALDSIRPGTVVGWAVKADPASMTESLAQRIASRAAVITYSASERAFVEDHCRLPLDQLTRQASLVVETNGSQSARFCERDSDWRTGTPPPSVTEALDTTGAGDTFAASTLSRFALAPTGNREVADIVASASTDATDFLVRRADERES